MTGSAISGMLWTASPETAATKTAAGSTAALAGCRAWLQVHVAVDQPQLDVIAAAELPPDPTGHRDRSVPAPCAADCDRQVLLALGDVGREQEVEQRHQAAVELA